MLKFKKKIVLPFFKLTHKNVVISLMNSVNLLVHIRLVFFFFVKLDKIALY